MEDNSVQTVEEPTQDTKKRRAEDTEEAPNKKARRDVRPEQWKKFELLNPSFEEYYRNQPFLEPSEHEVFFRHLRTELPSSFRVNLSSTFRHSVAKHLEKLCAKLTGVNYLPTTEPDAKPVEVEPPQPLQWYPEIVDKDGVKRPGAYAFALPKRFLKKIEPAAELSKYLIEQNDMGTITRQEEVSMIPPLFLEVKPEHYVLDMCAAPGSKTSQLVEMLHALRDTNDNLPSGFVIANDADRKRCATLSHQINRFDSPCVCVTNHQGQFFPALVSEKYGDLLFDRILCDVPCSGDGTLRKNPDLWDKWNTAMGPGLHGVQLSIAHRAFDLLKPGGRIVYSTCSMNPVEDEAVLATLLRKFKGRLELVDVSGSHPELKRRPGIYSWKIMDRDGNWYEKHDDLPDQLKNRISRTCFPPTPEEAAEFHLERSFRILPHDQNTGGFFVAVLQKLDVPVDTTITEEKDEKKNARKNEKSMKNINKGKDALVPLPEKSKPYWETTKNFYGISDEFSFDNLVCHSQKDKPNKISLISPLLSDVLKHNLRLKVVGAGLVILVPVTPKMEVDYKPASLVATSFLAPFMTKRIVAITESSDLINLITSQDPFFSTFSEPMQRNLENIGGFGPCIFSFQAFGHKMHASGWKGHVSCKIFMSGKERYFIVKDAGGKPATTETVTTEDSK